MCLPLERHHGGLQLVLDVGELLAASFAGLLVLEFQHQMTVDLVDLVRVQGGQQHFRRFLHHVVLLDLPLQAVQREVGGHSVLRVRLAADVRLIGEHLPQIADELIRIDAAFVPHVEDACDFRSDLFVAHQCGRLLQHLLEPVQILAVPLLLGVLHNIVGQVE